MLIAQISDTHIVAKGELLHGRVDSAAHLRQALEQLRTLDTVPDCVLLTGDLTNDGSEQQYDHLRELLAPLTIPCYAIPGNHDRREPMRAAFHDRAWMPKKAGEPVCYSFDLDPLRVIALDTLVEGADGGELGDEQLRYLARSLDDATGRPVLIALHHPPLASGIPSMDTMRLRSPEKLAAIVERYANIERVICGHLHRAMHARWHGTTVSVSPSTVDQIYLAFARSTPAAAIAEPIGMQLHYWTETDRLITHTVPIGRFEGPFPYG
jgi:3',5'-cyclic AMP phosphodiesterase CpdA